MKRLLLLLLSSFLLFKGNAQDDNVNKFDFKINDGYKSRLSNKQILEAIKDSNIVLNNLAFLKGRKPGVYRLPQDNMPCIVPDTTKTVRMPNAWKGPLRVPYRSNAPRIPNPTKQWVPVPMTNSNANAK